MDQNKPCYLENPVVREPCKQRTACISSILERHTINWTSFLSAPMIMPEMGNLDNGETMKTITGFPFSKKHPNRIDWDDDLVSSRPPSNLHNDETSLNLIQNWFFLFQKFHIFIWRIFEPWLCRAAPLFHNGLNYSLNEYSDFHAFSHEWWLMKTDLSEYIRQS